jgi:hypothetical protein
MKLIVEVKPNVEEFEIDDDTYADFLASGEDVYYYFDSFISDVDRPVEARIVNSLG